MLSNKARKLGALLVHINELKNTGLLLKQAKVIKATNSYLNLLIRPISGFHLSPLSSLQHTFSVAYCWAVAANTTLCNICG